MISEGLYNIDCSEGMKKIKKESVNIVTTDPPYIKAEWEEAYTVLGKGAMRILKPSGYLITYCGHYYLPGVLKILQDAGLIYYWQLVQLNSGEKALMHHRNILAGYKPILVFQKPPLDPTNKIFLDVISGKKSKEHHAWEQDIHEALHLLSRFGREGDLICDPFVGSGTWILAGKLLGMQYIGFERDPVAFKTAQSRLLQEPLTLSSEFV